MSLIYTAVILLYGFCIRIAAIFNTKAKLMIKGRLGVMRNLEYSLKRKRSQGSERLVWFHCASLGEFEQGRPLIETFRKHHPDYLILLTFHSPSGYEVRKAYPGADLIYYLPFDTRTNARRFVELVNPDLVFFIKYEFWYNYLHFIQKKNIPLYLVSGIFRADQHFFKWYGSWARRILKGFDMLFVQNQYSREVLEFVGVDNVTVCGDTRFDRVLELKNDTSRFPVIEDFISGEKVIVAGSTWEEDEEILLKYFTGNMNDFKLIIAPHEVQESHIGNLLSKCESLAQRYSTIQQSGADPEKRILIIDSIGILNKIYRFAEITYIGGGFGKGIHNILEPASFNKPVIVGPRYTKFAEAVDLIHRGGAFSIMNENELNSVINQLKNKSHYENAARVCREYISEKTGATSEIMKYLEQYIFNQ